MTELSALAQHWIAVVLIWVGFGSLAGLVARVILPLREPSGPLPTLTLGITGSAVGLGILSWVQGGGPHNPIGPLGFVAATGGAFLLLVLYWALGAVVHRGQKDPRHPPETSVPNPAPSAETVPTCGGRPVVSLTESPSRHRPG
ncbi:MAG: GlsB/YeaQ/YmgE family stress response membrane protein [Thermoguttaceae bacterium]|jgi:uncharacterized membrane protein YeaQ/YmgE (transglycosylase-associated protein family)